MFVVNIDVVRYCSNTQRHGQPLFVKETSGRQKMKTKNIGSIFITMEKRMLQVIRFQKILVRLGYVKPGEHNFPIFIYNKEGV